MTDQEIKDKANKFVINNVSWDYWMNDINAQRLVYYFEQGYKTRIEDEQKAGVLHGKLSSDEKNSAEDNITPAFNESKQPKPPAS